MFHYISPSNLLSESEIRVVNADGSNEHAVFGPGVVSSPDWSPDGTRILFVLGENDGTRSIVSISTDGSDLVKIRDRMAWDGDPAWSPDGQHIAFVSNCLESTCSKFVSDLWVANADGSGAARLTAGVGIDDDASHPTWSPDGQWVAFGMKLAHVADIYRIRPDGADLERLTAGSAEGGNIVLFSFPTYSPDGAFLAYIVDGAVAPLATSLMIARSDGSSPELRPLSIGQPTVVTWGP